MADGDLKNILMGETPCTGRPTLHLELDPGQPYVLAASAKPLEPYPDPLTLALSPYHPNADPDRDPVSPQASTKLAEQLGRFRIEISSDSIVEIAAIPQARLRILTLTLILTLTPTPTLTLTPTGAPADTAQP